MFGGFSGFQVLYTLYNDDKLKVGKSVCGKNSRTKFSLHQSKNWQVLISLIPKLYKAELHNVLMHMCTMILLAVLLSVLYCQN